MTLDTLALLSNVVALVGGLLLLAPNVAAVLRDRRR